MTTASWSTPVDHTTTAGYRTWGTELGTKFAAVGLVQTSDTGQINWTTTTLPAPNTTNGYEIWRLSSGNLYFKLVYGTGNATALPEIDIQVGTGSNGSGTLTGQLSTNESSRSNGVGVTSPTTNWQSYLCATANYVMLSWKLGASSGGTNQASCFFLAAQTVDSTGVASSTGYYLYAWANGSQVFQCVATSAGVTGPAQALGASNGFMLPFGTPSSSSQDGSGNDQAYLCWFAVPGFTPVLPVLHVASILSTDLILGATATLTLVGSTPHTYIAATQHVSSFQVFSATSLKILALYE